MDIEGAEHGIVPEMARTGALKLVDVFLWECHTRPGQKCHVLRKVLTSHGVAVIHDDPYPFVNKSYGRPKKGKKARSVPMRRGAEADTTAVTR
jgi:hypothetical protein